MSELNASRSESALLRPAAARRRTAYYSGCATLAVATAVLLYLGWQERRAALVSHDQPVIAPASVQSADRIESSGPPDLLNSTIAGQAEQGMPTAALMFDRSSEPLKQMPADLPKPTDGSRQWGFQRTHTGMIEQVVTWRVEGASVEQLAAFYTAAAKQRGFTPLSESHARAGSDDHGSDVPGEARVLNYTASSEHHSPPTRHAAWRVLTVRLTPRDEAVHLLIALRYANSPDESAATAARRGVDAP